MTGWSERIPDEALQASLEAAGKPPLVARLLANRGISAEACEAFFNPSLKGLMPPESLPGVEESAEKIIECVREGGEIVIFGDYDCDGISACAIASVAIRAIGGKAEAFIPRRVGEGYGMTPVSVERMLQEHPGVRLVVTVDNGIGSVDVVAGLRARGVRVVITDHHLPGDVLPDADALVNPRVAAPPELADLCGAAVAFFVANRLVRRAKELGMYSGPSLGEPLLVLAGLATVTDVMPICGQNRIMVAESLRRFMNPDDGLESHARRGAPPGLKALFDKCTKVAKPVLAARDFGFGLGPRINAVGRLEGAYGTAMDVLQLVLSRDDAECRRIAAKVDECNSSRKGYEQHMTDAAMAQIDPALGAQVINFSASEAMVHPGVAGIVASRILDRLENKVPVCVLVDGKGSSRAPAGYNVRDALAGCSGYLSHFGGHAAAAGLGIKTGALDMFRKAFSEACMAQAADIPPEELAAVRYDAALSTADLTPDFVQWIAKMEPFGEGNPEPLFVMKGAGMSEVRLLGRDGRHVSAMFADAAGSVRGIWWYHGEDIEILRRKSAKPVDVLFVASVSKYGGDHVELRILDIRPSGQ